MDYFAFFMIFKSHKDIDHYKQEAKPTRLRSFCTLISMLLFLLP